MARNESPSATEAAPTPTLDAAAREEPGAWTPVAKTHARVERAATEEPGSMQHFAAALHLSDVITKLHALSLIGIIERFEQIAPSPISFELARATSTGAWVGAVRDAAVRARPAMVAGSEAQEWLAEMRRWLTRKRGRPDEESLGEALE